jgi:hypothetical protein
VGAFVDYIERVVLVDLRRPGYGGLWRAMEGRVGGAAVALVAVLGELRTGGGADRQKTAAKLLVRGGEGTSGTQVNINSPAATGEKGKRAAQRDCEPIPLGAVCLEDVI